MGNRLWVIGYRLKGFAFLPLYLLAFLPFYLPPTTYHLIFAQEVKSVIKEGDEASDIRDIKPPVDIPVSYLKLYLWGGIPLVLLACGGAVYWFLQKRRHKVATSVIIERSPYEIACEALNELSKSDLITKGQVKEYYFSLSDIVRHYIENRFQLMAPERTTEEFLIEMSNANKLQDKHKQLVRLFLKHCDLVKFARYSPDSKEIKDAFGAALRLIDETKEIIEQTEEHSLVTK